MLTVFDIDLLGIVAIPRCYCQVLFNFFDAWHISDVEAVVTYQIYASQCALYDITVYTRLPLFPTGVCIVNPELWWLQLTVIPQHTILTATFCVSGQPFTSKVFSFIAYLRILSGQTQYCSSPHWQSPIKSPLSVPSVQCSPPLIVQYHQ